MRRLDGHVSLITGAAAGIGRATAERFASEGATMLLCDVQDEGLTETAEKCRALGADVKPLHCDVAIDAQVEAAVAACAKHFGRIDSLCNIAGILKFEHSTEISIADFQRIVDVNLVGTFRMCRAALPHLLESKGAIVNTASTAGLMGLPYGQAYGSSKAGVIGLTRSLAVEYGGRGLRVNAVCPGSISTAMGSPKFPKGVEMKLLLRADSLCGARGPEVVASVIAMLASQDGIHVNGETIRMDGGALA